MKVVKIMKEDLGGIILEMKWGFQKKATLPLTDIMGFQIMLQQVGGLKNPKSAIIIVQLTMCMIISVPLVYTNTHTCKSIFLMMSY